MRRPRPSMLIPSSRCASLESADARWRSRYDEEKANWATEKEALIAAHADALKAQAEEHQRAYDALQAELDRCNMRKQAMIDRIRGVDHE